ncbi:hypothetical protein [Nostoc sp.]|uniref:hypothetical protein n=1 Tax=Nostoc sp. TaxID=1180 RepID=UPI002FFC1B3F
MSDELVELDFCCPECNCSEWRHDKDNGVYSCARCDYVMAFDEDDPDFEEDEEEDYEYDGDTGRAFIDGRWVVVSRRTWARWKGESY